jgi:hypothetical protein
MSTAIGRDVKIITNYQMDFNDLLGLLPQETGRRRKVGTGDKVVVAGLIKSVA